MLVKVNVVAGSVGESTYRAICEYMICLCWWGNVSESSYFLFFPYGMTCTCSVKCVCKNCNLRCSHFVPCASAMIQYHYFVVAWVITLNVSNLWWIQACAVVMSIMRTLSSVCKLLTAFKSFMSLINSCCCFFISFSVIDDDSDEDFRPLRKFREPGQSHVSQLFRLWKPFISSAFCVL